MQVADTRVVGHCGCGACPSVHLAVSGTAPVAKGRHESGVLLEAFIPGAVLLLLIDDDQPNYLELSPLDPDEALSEFPSVDRIEFSSPS